MSRCLYLAVISFFLLSPAQGVTQVKRALLVAVGNYPANSGCPPIASVNDLRYIRETLRRRDFTETNIAELKDSKATKNAILLALDALAKKSKKGDIVVIFFGCHGQQIRDQATAALGKDEADGYDESLLPYDARGQYNPGSNGYRGQNHLRDDELGIKLTAIRNAIGNNGSLLVLLDACHSGSGTRDDDEFSVYRGEPMPFPDPEQPDDSTIIVRGVDENDFLGAAADSASNMVVISGSGPNQKNYQTIDPSVAPSDPKRKVGSLTFAFAKAMAELPADADYQMLFERIRAGIQADHPMQLPMIEGRTNQKIFSGQYKAQQEKIVLKPGVRDLQLRGDTMFTIDRGTLHNITNGAGCKIYDATTGEFYAEATISKTGNFSSIGVSARPLKKGVPYEVKMNAVSSGIFGASILVRAKDNNAKQFEKKVKDLLAPYQFLSFNNDADMMVSISSASTGTSIKLVDAADSTLWMKSMGSRDSLTNDDAGEMINAIKSFIRVRYLRSLSDGGDLTRVVSANIYSRDNPGPAVKELELTARERYSLKLDYTTDTTIYYSIINILPDNNVKVLVPPAGINPEEYSIKGNGPREIRLKVDSVPVPGKEIFKIVLSKTPLNLRAVLERKSTRSSGDHPMVSIENAIDDLFKDSEDARATRSDVSEIKAEEIGILTVGFTVKRKI